MAQTAVRAVVEVASLPVVRGRLVRDSIVARQPVAVLAVVALGRLAETLAETTVAQAGQVSQQPSPAVLCFLGAEAEAVRLTPSTLPLAVPAAEATAEGTTQTPLAEARTRAVVEAVRATILVTVFLALAGQVLCIYQSPPERASPSLLA